jgi:hypothetical protein
MGYLVTYENDIDNASDVLDAAKSAWADIVNGEALCFTVKDNSTGKTYSVDLSEPDDDAVIETSE